MKHKTAKTIMLTTKCSGGCLHCPFSTSGLEKLFLAPVLINKMISQSLDKLILSGGEPFEHPEITKILNDLIHQKKVFRINSHAISREANAAAITIFSL